MSTTPLNKKQTGGGLIEVLIAMVVIAVGLLAVASMQGNIVSSSSENKTRAEAIDLAEQKIEAWRNNINESDFTGIGTGTGSESVTGVNAAFTRGWNITDVTSTRKEIAVTVSWGANTDQRVMLTSQIAFSDPGNSAGIAAYGAFAGKSPSPNQSSSESINDTTALFDSAGNLLDGVASVSGTSNLYTKDGKLYRDEGNNIGRGVSYCDQITGLMEFDPDLTNPLNYYATGPNAGTLKTTGLINLVVRRLDLDNVTGNEAIELYRRNYIGNSADGSCTPLHRYFGGAIITIKGNIRTVNSLDDIKVDFNKTDMLCVYNPGQTEKVRPYACYAGANCNYGPAGSNTNVRTCPDPTAANADVGPGGFSGNVGLLNLKDSGGSKENVCFADELNYGPITTYATARKYKTLNDGAEQGINRSYDCQDFYIVDRQANFSKLAAKCAEVVGTLNLPPKEVIRTISGDNVLGNTTANLANTSYCSARVNTTYTIAVSLPSVSGVTYTLIPPPNGTCSPTPVTSTATCTVTTAGTAIQILAISSTGSRGSCIVADLAPDPTDPSTTTNLPCSITPTNPPVYTIVGPLTQPNGVKDADYEVRPFDTFGPATNPCVKTVTEGTSGYYTCTVPTNDAIVTLKTIKIGSPKAGQVIDYCSQAITIGTATYDPSCGLTAK